MEEMQWNKDRLFQLVRAKLGDSLFIVVSNREPYVHTMSGSEITWNRPVSGLIVPARQRTSVGLDPRC